MAEIEGMTGTTSTEPQNASMVRVYERVIDVLLQEELHASKAFRTWWLERIGISWAHEHIYHKSHRSVYDLGRESDLVLLVAEPGGERHAILIEDKIVAAAQPEQSLGYRKRGKAGIDRKDWREFTTCIVAPQFYLDSGPNVQGYDTKVSLESVRDWLSASDMEQARREFKLEILSAAISPAIRGGTRTQKEIIEVIRTISPEEAKLAQRFLDWSTDNFDRIGSSLSDIVPELQLASNVFSPTYIHVERNVARLAMEVSKVREIRPFDIDENWSEFRRRLDSIHGAEFWHETPYYLSVKLSALNDDPLEAFLQVIRWSIDQVRAEK
jgi:hypothetical protein